MIHVAVPRDFVVLIAAGWIWVGFWTSRPHPDEDFTDWLGELVREWTGLPRERRRRGLERWRNGWTFVGATILAIGFGILCYAMPWVWL